ncbi:carbamate kinase-like carbamoyl phosphate synthetase [Thermosipho africanus H17ap60334]|jgi:carbamate kinase|uniref:Carbamate kinase n=1 Tax=Thermosipho africanus (strain TCF52B) TaxID=484019 RepID=B7IHJ3_THEAB|nr:MULTISPECIES: carbamate kinase [Thermosipho]HCF38042.1 carbamate kinase [Thermosipho africanus]ACJ75557.1 carbamate kinase [Thermosipho africanus TCF52B]EKF49918.1 carbamate kinase-like carbamoyl phosphate synthetase [Thermosipho africanus H17ap60334]MBZ4650836.1 arcC [Thermosipho sp. (in: thermotogales)]RDI91250.1 carbamate kinase-like carbamoyl phosphate synthetase [Thermosipho africanus Ob7]
MKKLAVVAIGGNAINRPGEKPTAENMFKNIKVTASYLADMIELGYRIIITHGNGPQVGNLLVQQDIAKDTIPPFPMDVLGAMTQGYLGYMISQELKNVLNERKIDKEIATVVTQIVVNKDDPGFKNPTKPVGPFYSEEEAKKIMEEKGWIFKEDAGRGWRRVVPSPIPLDVIEKRTIKDLVENDVIVVAGGGGGIPVIIDEKGEIKGVEAVIDKDRASALIAKELDADEFIILTAVEKVYLNFNKPDQKPLDTITVKEAEKYMNEGHFAKGSMLPKIEACISFVTSTNRPALITDMEKLKDALEGKTGTRIIP